MFTYKFILMMLNLLEYTDVEHNKLTTSFFFIFGIILTWLTLLTFLFQYKLYRSDITRYIGITIMEINSTNTKI